MKKDSVTGNRPSRRFAMAASLCLCLVLLCGCTQAAAPIQATAPEAPSIPTIAATGLYDPNSPWEEITKGALRAYPLQIQDAKALLPFSGGLLLVSGEETILTLFAGETLTLQASYSLGFPLSAQDPSLRVHGNGLSYFDKENRETVVLDSSLNPVSHIPAPAGLMGSPVLSLDRSRLYYCTANALMVWELEDNIHKTLKEMAYPGQTVAGLHAGDTVVQCLTEEGCQFLSADTGAFIAQGDKDLYVETQEDFFFASYPLAFDHALLFGNWDDPQILLPELAGDAFFLGRNQALVSSSSQGTSLILDYYDLISGWRQSRLTLETAVLPKSVTGFAGYTYLLMEDATYGCDVIYRWEPGVSAINDATAYGHPYLPSPTEEDLASCQGYGDTLTAKYGISLLLGNAAAAVSTPEYRFEAESQPAILEWELTLLEQRLQAFPEKLLQETIGDFDSLNLCLVRRITSLTEGRSLDSLQFLTGKDAYIILTCGQFSQQALYHALFLAMETHIFTHSIAFDQWDALNPAGFLYGSNPEDIWTYLQGTQCAFANAAATASAREDRAWLFTYAMLDNCDAYFQAPPMQAKLRAICGGIREAFDLEDSEESYPWEQYLVQ